jgi:hypothetical protein
MLLIIFGLVYVLLGVVKMPVKFSIPICVGLVVFSTLAMALITYCGFKEEEIEDAKKLAELYNKVKDERIHQMNNQRMELKLKAMNKSRSDEEVDRQFLKSYNGFRLLSLKTMESLNDQKTFNVLFICMQEIAFSNPAFLKRLSTNLLSDDQSTKPENKLALIREFFAVHLPILLFGCMPMKLNAV